MAKKQEKIAEVTGETLEANEPVLARDESEDDVEMNAGLKVSVRDVFTQKEEARKQREEQRASRNASASIVGVRISRQKILADTPYGVKPLHDFDNAIELLIHSWRGDDACHEICKQHYGEECDICKTTGTKFGESYAIPCVVMLGYVYNNVGATFDKVDSRGDLKTYSLQPIKSVEIPLGKDDCNVTVMKEANRRNYFTDEIWLIERKKGKGFSVPKTISAEEFQKKAGKTVDLNLPETALKIKTLTKREILRTVLSTFDNVQWEKLGFKAPEAAPAQPAAEEKHESSSRESF